MMAWVVGDYWAWLGELPRTEATILLLLAIALVWLRPTVAETCSPVDAAGDAPAEGGVG
jgi:hypothetical protein